MFLTLTHLGLHLAYVGEEVGMQRVGPHVLTIGSAGDVTELLVERAIDGAGDVAAAPIHAAHGLVLTDLAIGRKS